MLPISYYTKIQKYIFSAYIYRVNNVNTLTFCIQWQIVETELEYTQYWKKRIETNKHQNSHKHIISNNYESKL